jgi:tRNA 2-selenouridine synthase
MATEKIKIESFLPLSKNYPVFDVRSPSEFSRAHIPGAYSLPLFNDEERKIIGTTYKQIGRQQAIKIGLDYFSSKMKSLLGKAEEIINSDFQGKGCVFVHCWRGGMRSAALSWLLDLYGYKVYTLVGGYKAFRNWVLQQFDKTYKFKILGGYTGSGKTLLIKELKRLGYPAIDLEDLAVHKGSAFGECENPQPRQEMYENLIAINLFNQEIKRQQQEQEALSDDFFSSGIWLEDESQRIGGLNVPGGIWNNMRNSDLYFIDVPFEERLNYITATYGAVKKQNIIDAILRIEKRLGGLEANNAIQLIQENNIQAAFSILLKYYDKYYEKALNNRKNLYTLLNKIPCNTVSLENINKLSSLQTSIK